MRHLILSSWPEPTEGAYLSALSHLVRALPRVVKVLEGRVAPIVLEFPCLGGVGREFADELLHPGMGYSEPSSPRTSRRSLTASCKPPERQPANHFAFLRTAPGPKRPAHLPRFSEVSHRRFIRRHASLPPKL